MRLPQQPEGPTSSASHPDPGQETQTAATLPRASGLPDAPSLLALPIAEPVTAAPAGIPVTIRANEQRKQGSIITLTGEVVIEYGDYKVRADKATYDQDTSVVEAEGHLQLEGGPDDELITASHGSINLDQQTGRFFDVLGTIGVHVDQRRVIYTNANPFIFTGRVVIKTGPSGYKVIDGTMTSCRLPKPDWRLVASNITVDNGQARARHSTFRLLQVPILYLPYVSHPVDAAGGRQTGFLIPTFGTSSTKGYIMGDSIYWVINRSTDATFGTEYYSKRGWAPNGEFRYRGFGENFVIARFNSLLDRGLAPNNINQGGADLVFVGRRDFSEHSRGVANIEYLSSYIYRQAFTENFAQAVSSEVKSSAFAVHTNKGLSESVQFERYQSFESTTPGNEVRILHLPSAGFEVLDQPLARSRFYWGFGGTAAGLSRTEQDANGAQFATSREIFRLDLYPHLSLPFTLGGWSFRPEVAARNTFYSKSQYPQDVLPTEKDSVLNRSDLEAGFELRPPALERVFDSGWLVDAIHRDIKHVIQPEVQYWYVAGIDNFRSVLRFDTTDIASDTNEVTYSVTQRLYLKDQRTHACKADETPDASLPPGQCYSAAHEWLTWRLAQRYYIDPNFGGAVTRGARNVLEATLDLTGVAFLTGPRDVSPVLSRLLMRTSGNTELEWDLDYDTKQGRIQASNVFASFHEGNLFGGVGHARMVALQPAGPNLLNSATAPTAVTNYQQLTFSGGYGSPSRRGLSAAASLGFDFAESALQYAGVQTSYNWDCCGFNVEYRRFALGSVRNENQYRFNFTLAGVGTAGNLRRAERIF